MFDDVPTDIVIGACEAVLARSRDGATVNLNGVVLKCLVNHMPSLDRYMLIGEDWSVGFNLAIPEKDTQNVHHAFGSEYVISTPGVENWDAFRRDMVVLTLTQNFWTEKTLTHQKRDDSEAQLIEFIRSRA